LKLISSVLSEIKIIRQLTFPKRSKRGILYPGRFLQSIGNTFPLFKIFRRQSYFQQPDRAEFFA